jgi:hypothetical protein
LLKRPDRARTAAFRVVRHGEAVVLADVFPLTGGERLLQSIVQPRAVCTRVRDILCEIEQAAYQIGRRPRIAPASDEHSLHERDTLVETRLPEPQPREDGIRIDGAEAAQRLGQGFRAFIGNIGERFGNERQFPRIDRRKGVAAPLDGDLTDVRVAQGDTPPREIVG